ncbi:phage holin family protein [Nocardioides sp. zg-1308]|uniref:Phage holin family protein n=1 Tax=Nocardioides renjunii TaxID=3095075 RepID=A0ABU5KB38_9ACTN|nr:MULTISPECIES: phage holin family protein [unclassified Nocardioides]MDZ5662187.1 phage holin family protein [Nocardioides sp. S-58]NPD06106.1 phage holin family protein [Nocardioides sp. zg-1308]
MLVKLLLAWIVVAAAIAAAAAVVPSVEIDGGVLSLLWVALLFGLVNALIGPVLQLLALPLTIITLGLFALVVNGILLAITAGLTDSLDVGGLLSTTLAAIVISVVTAVLLFVLDRVLGGPRAAHPAQA